MADPFFNDLEPDDAFEIERLSRLAYDLRENRRRLLADYGVESEDALLERIRAGELAEHPAYDHYLSALVLEDSRIALRNQVGAILSQLQREGGKP